MNDLRANLIVAWAAWDARPGNDQAAHAMVAACRAYAGGPNLHLRDYLARARRQGLSYGEALDTWEQERRW